MPWELFKEILNIFEDLSGTRSYSGYYIEICGRSKVIRLCSGSLIHISIQYLAGKKYTEKLFTLANHKGMCCC